MAPKGTQNHLLRILSTLVRTLTWMAHRPNSAWKRAYVEPEFFGKLSLSYADFEVKTGPKSSILDRVAVGHCKPDRKVQSRVRIPLSGI